MRFSERMGIVPVRSVLQKDGMDDALRNSIWNALRMFLFGSLDEVRRIREVQESDRLTALVWVYFFKLPMDDRPRLAYECLRRIHDWFFAGAWYQPYELVEFALSDLFGSRLKERDNFKAYCNKLLEREMSAYRIVGMDMAPLTSEEEIKSIEEAQKQTGRFEPISIHLQAALRLLSDRQSPDYRNSVKESISAVESMACIVAGAPKATLGAALTKLEKRGVELHGALKDAFEKLYGYTSDAEGIRHKLLDDPKLDFDDAKFMLVACSAFVNYLKAKAPS